MSMEARIWEDLNVVIVRGGADQKTPAHGWYVNSEVMLLWRAANLNDVLLGSHAAAGTTSDKNASDDDGVWNANYC